MVKHHAKSFTVKWLRNMMLVAFILQGTYWAHA